MQQIKFISPLPPSVNSYLGKRVAYSGGKAFVQVYETAEAKAYKKHMKKVIERALDTYTWEKTGEYTYVVCEMTVFLNQKHRDSDNMQKCLLDSMVESGLVYDDSMIIPQVTNIFIDSSNPRIEICMYESPKAGIFLTEEEFNSFKGFNCDDCSRTNTNCSIRRKALENRVVSEINLEKLVCESRKVRVKK